jgi:hypothetical protein
LNHLVHGVNYVRQTEIHTAEPLVTESSVFEFGVAISLKGKNHHELIKSQQI